MADLLVRDIDPELKRQVEERARAHRRSLSEEAKVLIRTALGAPEPDQPMGTWMRDILPAEFRSDDLNFEYRGEHAEPPTFE